MEGEEELLLSLTANLRITHIATLAGILCVSAVSIQGACTCPLCGQKYQQIHSRYRRVIADVPCGAQQVSLHAEGLNVWLRQMCIRKKMHLFVGAHVLKVKIMKYSTGSMREE